MRGQSSRSVRELAPKGRSRSGHRDAHTDSPPGCHTDRWAWHSAGRVDGLDTEASAALRRPTLPRVAAKGIEPLWGRGVILLTGHLAEVIEAMLPSIEASLPRPLRIICSRENSRPALVAR